MQNLVVMDPFCATRTKSIQLVSTRLLLGWEEVDEAIIRCFALQTIRFFFNTGKRKNICEGGRVAAAFVTLNLLKRHIAQISQLTSFREISVGVNQPAWIETHARDPKCAARIRILPKRCLRSKASPLSCPGLGKMLICSFSSHKNIRVLIEQSQPLSMHMDPTRKQETCLGFSVTSEITPQLSFPVLKSMKSVRPKHVGSDKKNRIRSYL